MPLPRFWVVLGELAKRPGVARVARAMAGIEEGPEHHPVSLTAEQAQKVEQLLGAVDG